MLNDSTLHPDLEKFRKRLEPTIIATGASIFTIRGLSLANCHFILGEGGVIVVDSGSSLEEGKHLRKLIRTISDQPVRAVLLTHSHYSGGLRGLLEREIQEGSEVAIVGHPRIPLNLSRGRELARAVWSYRVNLENGSQLPREGIGAVHAPARSWRDGWAFCDLTHTPFPGENLKLAGLKIRIEKGFFDTDDGLAYRFVELDAVAHNLVTDQFPNFGSLGGGRYRDPLPWLEAVEALQADPPAIFLPCHGETMTGRDRIRVKLGKNSEAVRFLYEETLRRLARGESALDCRASVGLPDRLKNDPELRCLYGEVEHAVLAFAYGETGFWSGEIRELLPLPPDDEAHCLEQLCGDKRKLIFLAEDYLAQGQLGAALHFADAAVRRRCEGAVELRGKILRAGAGQTTAWTLRNTLLTLSQKDPSPTEKASEE